MITANMHDAKSRLSQIVIAAEEREEVFICRNGKRVVRLVPVPASPPTRNLSPDPRLRPILMPGYDPAEPLSEDEWPADLQ